MNFTSSLCAAGTAGGLNAIEPLEPRRLFSVFLVTTAADNLTTPAAGAGTGTLRQAIIDADASTSGGPAVIKFAIGSGPQTIELHSQLPALSATGATIDGTTQPGYHGTPLIDVDGSNILPSQAIVHTTGLAITANGCTVRGLAIDDVTDGIVAYNGLSTLHGCTFANNVIGANRQTAGVTIGIQVENSNSDQILGNKVENCGTGIYIGRISGGASTGNLISGNTIFNNGTGISIAAGCAAQISQNSIYSNSVTGISLAPTADNSIAPPTLFPSTTSSSGTIVQGMITGVPNTYYTIEFFATPASGGGSTNEGETFLYSEQVCTCAWGQAYFTASFPLSMKNDIITATATADVASPYTSTFSNAVAG